MRALILAAGLGTRLRPLTENIPKALIPVANIPVLTRNIEFLNSYGITEIIINSHYLSGQVADFVSRHHQGLTVRSEPEILGTGGGIINCRDFLDGSTFVVVNSDIITDINLEMACKNHRESGSPVTMVLHDREPFNMIRTDSNGGILEIGSKEGEGLLAFTGIHIMEPEIFSFLPRKGYSDIINEYRLLIESGININSFTSSGHIWHDIGTIDSYKNASRELLEINGQCISAGSGTVIDPSAEIRNWAVIGRSSFLKKNSVIENSVIWDNVTISEGVHVRDSVVTSEKTVYQNLFGEAF